MTSRFWIERVINVRHFLYKGRSVPVSSLTIFEPCLTTFESTILNLPFYSIIATFEPAVVSRSCSSSFWVPDCSCWFSSSVRSLSRVVFAFRVVSAFFIIFSSSSIVPVVIRVFLKYTIFISVKVSQLLFSSELAAAAKRATLRSRPPRWWYWVELLNLP